VYLGCPAGSDLCLLDSRCWARRSHENVSHPAYECGSSRHRVAAYQGPYRKTTTTCGIVLKYRVLTNVEAMQGVWGWITAENV